MKEESESAEDQTISEEEQEDADYEVELRIPAESGKGAPQEKVAECRRGRKGASRRRRTQ